MPARLMHSKNPATGAVIQELAQDSSDAVRAKYERARAAQPGWHRTALNERLNMVQQFAALLVQHRDRLAQILTSEVGKPIQQSKNELDAMAGRLGFFLEHTAGVLADEVLRTSGNTAERISWEPLGVVANVSAWNYPYFVGSNVFVPALLTGNTVLYKPSEHAALTGLALVDLMHQAGVPKDAFQCVLGEGTVGAALLEQAVDGVFFTGSYPTGKRIAQALASRLIRVQLELGGKDPSYVCDDVDVAAAVASLADGAFYNAGQSCCSVERIYIHEAVAQAFIEQFVSAVRAFKVGDPTDPATYIGPLARAAQLDVLDDQVTDALKQGAKVLCGGKRMPGPGNYFEPTVLTPVTSSMKVMREESFGPIIGLQVVCNDDEALALMNDTEYGLTAGVYSQNRDRAESILRRVNSGTAYWNCCDRVSPDLPWTGRRHSGLGSTLSTHGIRAFVQPKAWHLRSA